jgi:hypothetical protein
MQSLAIQSSDPERTQGTTVPNVLLRAFEKEEYAQGFIRGAVRLGLLTGYRAAEARRKDETEGIVRIAWRLEYPVYCERPSMNGYYILCTSHPETDRDVLTSRFGPYFVRIDDPMELLKRIEAAWQRHPLASGRCVVVPVVYNKDELLDPAPGLLPPHEYSYSQKPRSLFEEEREFRYVLTCTADVLKLRALVSEGLALENHLTLPLRDCGDICSLM